MPSARSCAERSKTTCSRSTWRAGTTSSRRSRRCGSPPTSSSTATRTCRSGTRSRSPATTSARRAAQRCRRSRSRSPTRSPTCEAALDAGLDRSTSSRPRLAFFFNCHNNVFQEIGEVPRGAADVGQNRQRALRGRRTRNRMHDPLPHSDRRRHAPGPAARGQHHPGRPPGLRRRRRRHPVAAHQRLRRGARAADRALGPDRPAHPAGARLRVRRRRHRRPLRRLLLRRVADRRDRTALLGADGEGRRARRLGGGAGVHPAGDRGVGARATTSATGPART